MNDRELDDLLQDAAARWRVPGDPPLDDIWAGVAREAFRPPSHAPGWRIVTLAASIALVIGVAAGRLSVRPATPSLPLPATTAAALRAAPDGADQRAMSELLGRTAVLLAALPADTAEPSPEISREGARLLTTTRLLLDSPVGSDARLRDLLQDLELVLAQVARFDPRHRRDEMHFIQSALDQHDLVPRLRSAAVDLSLDDF